MANYRNTCEGNTNGATVAAGGSSLDGQTPFDAVNVPTGATLAYDNSRSCTGGLSIKVATAATSGSPYVAWTTGITYAKPMYMSACFSFDANPGAGFRIFEFLTGSTLMFTCNLAAGGLFQGFDNAGSGTGATTNAIPTGTGFCRVEFKLVVASLTVAQNEIRLFNDPFSSTPTETKTSTAAWNTGSTVTPTELRFGHAANSTASQTAFWIDEIQASDTAYPPPPVWKRPSISVFRPAVLRAGTF